MKTFKELNEATNNSGTAKSTWTKFLANKKLMYIGSTFGKSIEEITVAIDGLGEKPFKVNRTFAGGVTDIKYTTETGEISHLNKSGKVYTYKNYFLIHNKASGDSIVVYRVS